MTRAGRINNKEVKSTAFQCQDSSWGGGRQGSFMSQHRVKAPTALASCIKVGSEAILKTTPTYTDAQQRPHFG